MTIDRKSTKMNNVEVTSERVYIYSENANIYFKHKFLEQITSGKKRSTTRKGIHIFPPECIVNLNFGKGLPIMGARIRHFEFKLLSQLSNADAYRDGFSTVSALTNELRLYYPQIDSNSVVTIIDFEIESERS